MQGNMSENLACKGAMGATKAESCALYSTHTKSIFNKKSTESYAQSKCVNICVSFILYNMDIYVFNMMTIFIDRYLHLSN